jgi:DNA mismatch endonuclease (patch repair protein)
MVDQLSPKQRSAFMANIRSFDTAPEVSVRRALHRAGYRFQLHGRGLPGRPDIVFTRRKRVVFVHGCFWHAHKNCEFAHLPKTRSDYWEVKFLRNRQRDADNLASLRRLGWRAIVVWECELNDLNRVFQRLKTFLGPTSAAPR